MNDEKNDPKNVAEERSGGEAWGSLANKNKKEGKLLLKFSVFMPTYAKYDILETDYENFVYILCKNESMVRALRYEWVFVLTRKPLSVSSDEFKEVETNAKAFLEQRKHIKLISLAWT